MVLNTQAFADKLA